MLLVASAAVERFGWLTADDMVAGLAVGESTPGPLIMVNTFVGFLAGYNVEGGLAWGLLGATIATVCTFVPLRVHHQRRADHRPDPYHRCVCSLAQRHHDRRRRGESSAWRCSSPVTPPSPTGSPTGS